MAQPPTNLRLKPRQQSAVIVAGQACYWLGYKPRLKNLAWYDRLLLWCDRRLLVWRDLADIHAQAVCFDEQQAAQWANRPGWFYAEAPAAFSFADCLPEAPVQGLAHSYPASPGAKTYERRFKLLKPLVSKLADMGQRAMGASAGMEGQRPPIAERLKACLLLAPSLEARVAALDARLFSRAEDSHARAADSS